MVYVHVPFCWSFCIYCDFYSCIPRKGEDVFKLFTDSLIREIESRSEELVRSHCGDSRGEGALKTLYFGGGTPSVLPPDCLRRITETLAREGLDSFDEFTLEVNPEDIVSRGESYVKEVLALGVNRVSMGVQSLDDGILRWMNRRHNASRARQAFEILRGAGVGNISVDLIFGISGLADSTLRDTVEELLSWKPEHISAYQLTLAEDSLLGKMAAGGKYLELPDEDCRRQYELICTLLGEDGYRHYEVSNWAIPGREASHNSAYWQRLPYVGLGPGAHSLSLTEGGAQVRRHNLESEDSLYSGEMPLFEEEILSAEDIRVEEIMLALRTDRGMQSERLESLCDSKTIAGMLQSGLLETTGPGERIRIPESQFFVSEGIIRELI